MLGVTVAGTSTLTRLLDIARAFPHVHGADVAMSAGVIVVVLAARGVARRIPDLLIAVIVAISVSRAADLAGRGVAVLGPLPRGLPHLGLPALGWHDAAALIGTAASMFVVILAQSAATSHAYAGKYEEAFSQDIDLVGLGAANVAVDTAVGVVSGIGVTVDAAAGQRRMRHDLDRPLDGRVGVNPVVFDADQAAEPGALAHAK